MENINFTDGDVTGWNPTGLGLYPECALVVTEEELRQLAKGNYT